MKDKDIITRAVDDYTYYTERRRKVLKVILSVTTDNIATISGIELAKVTKLSTAAIYKSLKTFERDGFIETVKNPDGTIRYSTYKINKSKLDNLIDQYFNKKSFS